MADQGQQAGTQPRSTDTSANQSRFYINIVNALVPKSRVGKIVAFFLFVILFVSYFYNFFHFRDLMRTFGFTLIGLITVIVMILFIFYGWGSFFKSGGENIASFYIATALFIWMLDLVPEDTWLIGQFLGPEWAGFEWILLIDNWTIPFVSVFFSAIFFAFMYIGLVLNIIEKEGRQAFLGFIFILISNYIVTKFFPNSVTLSFSVPYPKITFALVLLGIGFFGWWAYRSDKKRTGSAFPEFASSVFMYFVISFFLVNNGWQGNIRAWFHAVFILAFSFGYIKRMERDNPIIHKIFFPAFLLIEFFGYGLLWSSDLLALRFIPPFVIITIFYCYVKESNEIEGKRRATYPVLAFILLVTFILVMSLNVAGLQSGGDVPFVAKKGTNFKELSSQFTSKLRELIEGRLDIATAGLYTGNVEKNRYESLGVYFANVRAADPKFYTDEPITVWGSIRSKTYKDAVIINFSCYRLKDSKRIRADRIVPDIKFPIFTLEEVDTECTFLPKPKGDPLAISAGANTIIFSADYNFGTDAYLKAYFIDRDRYRAYARENIDPFKEFGIKDTSPVAVHTNGPVEIGMSTGQSLITVSQGYAVKPFIGVTLTNRKEIQDKDKRVITRWEGKIKNITELVILVPPGVKLENDDGADSLQKYCKSRTAEEYLKCPCNMPFYEYKPQHCFDSCNKNVYSPCEQTCVDAYNLKKSDETEGFVGKTHPCVQECETALNRCNQECTFLFEDEGGAKEKYKGYALDVGSLQFRDLNKDIDKYRSFQCRFNPSPDVLDKTPITTRYFRVRARYNYLLENSVTVTINQAPVIVDESLIQPGFNTQISEEKYKEVYANRLNKNEVQFSHIVLEAAKKYNVDYLFVKAIIQIESNWNPTAVGDGGDSSGLMQLSASAASGCNADYRTNPNSNIDCGVRYIRSLIDIQKNKNIAQDLRNIAAAYNCGPKALNPDTTYELFWKNPNNCWTKDRKTNSREYVSKVISFYDSLKNQLKIDYISSEQAQTTTLANAEATYDSSRKIVVIRWAKSENPKTTKYLVTRYNQGNSEDSFENTQNFYHDSNIKAGLEYSYLIYAIDNDYNIYGSAETNKVTIPITHQQITA